MPIIIVGLVTPAIAGIGKSAGKMLIATVAIADVDTVLCGMLAYGTGSALFPAMTEGLSMAASGGTDNGIEPYFTIKIPPILDVMSALVLSFIMGLGIAYGDAEVLRKGADEMMDITGKVISKAIIPLLPPYIFGIFLNMTATGDAYAIMSVFAKIIVVIFVLHIVILLYQFIVAGAITRRNPLRLLWRMLPAYFTALGTSSSAGIGDEDNGVRADHLHNEGHAARRNALHGIRDAVVRDDGGGAGSARRLNNGGAGTAGVGTGIRRAGPGSYDCALHSHG